MLPQMFNLPKSKKWLEEHNINYTERNIAENNPSYEELKGMACQKWSPAQEIFLIPVGFYIRK